MSFPIDGIFEFCTVDCYGRGKNHIHLMRSDGTLSPCLCGLSPNGELRSRQIKKLTILSRRQTCNNCLITYDKLQRTHFSLDNIVMRRLLGIKEVQLP